MCHPPNNTTPTDRSFEYRMNNVILKTTDQQPYLGIHLNHKLSWNPHITQLCNKANRLLGFLHRSLKTSPMYIKEMACKQLILPIARYCSVCSTIWDPHQQYLIHKLEMVATTSGCTLCF